jgi:hypothetical protein
MQFQANKLRRPASLLVAVAMLGWLVLRADTGQSAPTAPVDPPTDVVFAAKVRPMIARYCLGCHSTKVKKGDLDLERFSSLEVARHDLKPWQSVIEMLSAEEMPPKAKPQPTTDERKWLIGWTHDWLDAEARARVGDPGPAALRRLSNAEYNATVRDLTRIDLQPAREFPADGAAGEGFTNAAEALSMSPALVEKYLAAAKGIADHAVLLPDGLRFSPASHQRDWVDESLRSLHAFYNHFAEPEGQLPLRRYLSALARNRAALAAGTKKFAEIAEQERLSPKYLETLWGVLNDARPSFVLDSIRAQWKSATPADVPAIAGQIEAWQKLAWTVVDKNAPGLYEVWIKPSLAISDSQTLRFRLNLTATQGDVVFYLVAHDIDKVAGKSIGGKDDNKTLILWDKARLEGGNQPPLSLRDVPEVANRLESSLRQQFVDTAKYLDAVALLPRAGAGDTVESVARERHLEPKQLQHWIDAVGLQKDSLGAPEPLAVKIVSSNGNPSVHGWGSPTADQLPILLTNASGQPAAVPGTIPPHGVCVHPSPDQYAAVCWTSPIEGSIHVETKVADAHAGCGNGVAWWLDALRAASAPRGRRDRLANGEFDDGKAATIAPRDLQVKSGDVLRLAIGARNRDHGCDLTLVDLTIKEIGGKGRTWNLSADVADAVLDANPRADRLGNKGVWLFARGQDNSASKSGIAIPPGSLLMQWRDALEKGQPQAELTKLADQVQTLLAGPPANGVGTSAPAPGSPDALLFAAVTAPGSPLVQPVDIATVLKQRDLKHPAAAGVSRFGLDVSRFGKHPKGQKIDETSFVTDSPTVVEIHLPAMLAANREFVVEGKIDPATVGSGFVQLQVLASPPKNSAQMAGGPVLINSKGQTRDALEQQLAEFRQTFPLMLCFGRVVPEDPDGITLRLFCRADEPLSRLMLDDEQRKQLDRLWSELQYVGREALKEQEAYPLFMGFASQVGLVPRFAPQAGPIKQRAEEFKQAMLASEPKQLDAMLDFATRAYRRPLAEREKTELLGLYQSLRGKKVAHEPALRAVLARILVSPDFLYHLEVPPPGLKPQPVNDWELASRLSYFLWSTGPDEELRRVAASGHLHEPAVLAEQTRRMLGSDRMRALAIEFGTQWIHVHGFDTFNEKNEKLFPMFNEKLRSAIYEESILFFQDLFQADRPVTDLLDSDHTFVNDMLAKYYGIPNVAGSEFRRIDGAKQYGRGGILGLASVQAMASGSSRTSPVLRGNWVVETLLGEKMPRPPPDVPKLPEEEPGAGGLSVRQLVEKHAKLAQCAVCHQRMDPFGFSLEHYDTIGRFREKDIGGAAIDSKAKLKDGTEFDGLDGLRNYLLTKKKDVFVRLFCRRLLGYAIGRETGPADQPLIDDMLAAMNQNHGHLSAAVLTIVGSPQFRLIRGGDFALPEVSEVHE